MWVEWFVQFVYIFVQFINGYIGRSLFHSCYEVLVFFVFGPLWGEGPVTGHDVWRFSWLLSLLQVMIHQQAVCQGSCTAPSNCIYCIYVSSCATSLFKDCPLTGIVGCHICMASPSETAGVEVKEALGITGCRSWYKVGAWKRGCLWCPRNWSDRGFKTYRGIWRLFLAMGSAIVLLSSAPQT